MPNSKSKYVAKVKPILASWNLPTYTIFGHLFFFTFRYDTRLIRHPFRSIDAGFLPPSKSARPFLDADLFGSCIGRFFELQSELEFQSHRKDVVSVFLEAVHNLINHHPQMTIKIGNRPMQDDWRKSVSEIG